MNQLCQRAFAIESFVQHVDDANVLFRLYRKIYDYSIFLCLGHHLIYINENSHTFSKYLGTTWDDSAV